MSADQGPGVGVLEDPLTDRGTAFTEEERSELGLRGLLPQITARAAGHKQLADVTGDAFDERTVLVRAAARRLSAELSAARARKRQVCLA